MQNDQDCFSPIEILMVEDNPGDVRLAREALKEAKVVNNLQVLENGVEAIRFLRNEGEFHDAVRPDLILLDLNLPGKNGQEVLGEIKKDPDLQSIPVVVLTTSSAEVDILNSYKLHANCYVTKPVDSGKFFGAIKAIEEFWLSIVKLPREDDR